MATVYSGWSTVWQPSGAKPKQYRAFLTYSITTSSTQVVVTAYSGVNINSSVGASYSATQTATDYSSSSGSGKTVFGETKTVTLISTKTYTYNRTVSDQTKTIRAGVASSNGSWSGTYYYATLNVTVPALGGHAVSYDANGGTGSIEGQTKYDTIDITLSDGTGFEWKNHTLLKWNTAADGTGTDYALGATYSTDADVILYAQWQLNAVEVRTKDSGEWFDAIIYTKVNGNIVMPHLGFTKVNGVWKRIIKGASE